MPADNSTFWGGLLEGFSGPMLQREEQQRREQNETRMAKLRVLGQIDPTTLDEKGREIYGQELDQVLGGGKGKSAKGGKKPSDMIGQIVEHVKDLTAKIHGPQGEKTASQPAAPPQAAKGPQPQIPSQVAAPPKPPSIGEILSHRKDPLEEFKKEQTFLTDERIREYNKTKALDAGGAYTVKQRDVTGDMLPEGAVDTEGKPIDKSRRYAIAENRKGDEKYFPAPKAKQTAAQMKLAERVKDRIASTGEDQETAELNVRKQDFKTEQQNFVSRALRNSGQKLSNEMRTKQVEKISKELDSGEGLSQKTAKILYDEAVRSARMAKQDNGADMATLTAPMDDLVNKELAKLGVTRDEVAAAMRGGNKGGGSSSKGVTPPPPPAGRPKVTIDKDGNVSVQ